MPANGAKYSFIIPGRFFPDSEHKRLREQLSETLLGLLMVGGKGGTSQGSTAFTVRDGLPDDDYGEANADWETGALTDNTVSTFINTSAGLGNNKAAGFYGVAALDANPAVDALIFRLGGSGGQPLGHYQLEQLYAYQESVGFFPDPIVYKAQDVVFVEVEARDTKAAPGDNLVLMSLVAEPKGPFVG